MPFNCLVGETLLLPKHTNSIKHLWVVITPPCDNPPNVAIVNITTAHAGSDTTVILKNGDHPFIVHDSSVYYIDARVVSVQSLLAVSVVFQYLASLDPQLVIIVQDGIFNSPHTSPKVKDFCKRALGR